MQRKVFECNRRKQEESGKKQQNKEVKLDDRELCEPCFSWNVVCVVKSRKSGITVSPGMEEMPSLNTPVQRLKVAILPLDLPCSGPVKVAILPLDLPCSGPVTHSVEILTTGKFHGKKPDRYLG